MNAWWQYAAKWSHYDLIQNEISYAFCVRNFALPREHTQYVLITPRLCCCCWLVFFFQQRKKLINKIWFIYAYVNYNCPDLSWLNWYENDIPYFFAYNIEQQRTRPFEISFFFARFIFYIHSAACIPWILIKKNMDTVQCRCKCLSCQFVLLVHSALNKFIEK